MRDAEQIFGVEIMTKHKVLQFFTFCILNFVQLGEGWMLLGIYMLRVHETLIKSS